VSNKVTTFDPFLERERSTGRGRNKLYIVDLALFSLSIFLLAKQNVLRVINLNLREMMEIIFQHEDHMVICQDELHCLMI
jgi:hypothetical protein